MEQWTGLEPASTGFEDQQLIQLAHHCMVRAEGIEPSTFRLWADYSNHWVIPASSHNESGGGRNRTCDTSNLHKKYLYKKAFGNFLYSIFMHRILLSTLPTELHHHPHDEEGLLFSKKLFPHFVYDFFFRFSRNMRIKLYYLLVYNSLANIKIFFHKSFIAIRLASVIK